jgi:UPF0755 protein
MAGSQDSSGSGRGMRRLIGGVVLVAGLLLGWLWLDYRTTVDSPLANRDTAYFEVGKGEGLARIAQGLAERGILARPLWFQVLAYASGAQKHLKYGEYEIPPGTSPRDLLDKMVAGKVRQYPVTVVEGWTFADMLALLARHPALKAEVSSKPPAEIMAFLGAAGQSPEGRFFPDTYFVTRGTSDLEVLQRAYGKMRTVLEQEWRARSEPLPLGSPDEALVLASIVEKETARPEERPLVAGVFVRRLAKGMRLQTDPTVIYGMGAAYNGNIRKEDLRRDTPYNTYTRTGLPPTPIALPGQSAIHAALHPDGGTSLYFVARGDGTHVFSSTLEEHQRAVDQHQKP